MQRLMEATRGAACAAVQVKTKARATGAPQRRRFAGLCAESRTALRFASGIRERELSFWCLALDHFPGWVDPGLDPGGTQSGTQRP